MGGSSGSSGGGGGGVVVQEPAAPVQAQATWSGAGRKPGRPELTRAQMLMRAAAMIGASYPNGRLGTMQGPAFPTKKDLLGV